jgi:hypothetical protein
MQAHSRSVISLVWSGKSQSQSQSQSQSYFTTGGLPPISSSWRQAPVGYTGLS